MDQEINNTSQPQEQSIDAPVNEPISKKPFFENRIFLIAGIIFVVVLILAGTFFFLSRNGNQSNSNIDETVTGNENVIMATVGDRQVYRSNVEAVAMEQYSAEDINDEIIEMFLPITIERVILDIESEKLGINIEPEENKSEYYQKLRSAVMSREIGTVTANMISFWVPAFGDIYPQTEEYQQMRDLRPQVFEEAKELFEDGESAYAIGQQILQEYPVYTPRLAVNSYILSMMQDSSLLQEPLVYDYETTEDTKILLDFMFNMSAGEIDTLVWPDGEGAALIQIVSKSEGDQISYEQWLNEKLENVVYN